MKHLLELRTQRLCPLKALCISVSSLTSRMHNSHTHKKATGRSWRGFSFEAALLIQTTYLIGYTVTFSSTHLWLNHLQYSQISVVHYHTLLHSHSRSRRTVHHQEAFHLQRKSHFLRSPQICQHCGPQKMVPLFQSRCHWRLIRQYNGLWERE